MNFRVAVLLLSLTAAGPVRAQRPTGAELYNRYVEATGGKEAVGRMVARHIWGRFEVPSQGITGPMEIFTAPPSRMLTKTEIPGFGSSQQGFDGETGWMMNSAMGPMILDGLALNQTRQQSDMEAVLHPERYVVSRETTGEAEYGKPCWEVTVKTTWGESYKECYDKAAGLLVATVRTQATPMGDIDATTVYGDYKPFDGVLMPTKIRANAMGIEQVIRIDSVSSKPIPDSVFALPAQIRAMKKP